MSPDFIALEVSHTPSDRNLTINLLDLDLVTTILLADTSLIRDLLAIGSRLALGCALARRGIRSGSIIDITIILFQLLDSCAVRELERAFGAAIIYGGLLEQLAGGLIMSDI
jgi:hypothetical protein